MRNQRPIVVVDVDRIYSEDENKRLRRVIPAWIISCCINCAVIASLFLINFSQAEDAETEVAIFETVVEDNSKPPNLENDEIGLDPDVQTNYNVDRIEEISVPGPVNAMEDVGIVGADPGMPKTLPPPPGLSGGSGGGVDDPNRVGRGGLIGGPGGYGGHGFQGAFSGRSGATRQKMLIEGGGNAASEAAVARGLKWLARHQAPDGRWSLNDFAQHGRCNCTGPGSSHCDVAATAFGLLPMLGAGQTHKGGADKGNLYTKTVENGLKFLLLQQARNGAFDPNHHHEMYAHGLATIAVCEAYGMTSDPALRYSAQRALNYIVQAQTPIGGWDYRPQKKPIYDGSITAWQLMALKSGQMAGLTVPIETLKRAMKALDEAATSDGGRYGYRSRHPENGFRPGTTAGGLMCRLYLGWGPRNPGLLSGLRYLRSYGPRTNNMYYSYYACQVMHNIGGAYWKEWNPKMRDGLIAAQDKGEKNPHQAGSWYDPSDHISSGKGGRVMQTSLSLFALEVYYRHLPLYQRISEDKELTQR